MYSSRKFKRWLSGLFLGLSYLVIFETCDEPSAVGPPPEIQDISPKEGVYGMHVTITGKNFGKTPDENIVAFANVNAKVITASESLLEVEVPPGASTGIVTILANGTQVNGPSFKYHDVYVVGNYPIGNTNTIKLWSSGLVESVTDETKNNFAETFIESDGNMFIAGYHLVEGTNTFPPYNAIPAYWKDKEYHVLSTTNGAATDICVSSGDVYVSGYELNGPHYVAKYWKNGEGVDLTNGVISNASSVAIAAGAVYVGGTAESFTIVGGEPLSSLNATYWKNGNKVPLVVGITAGSSLNDIEIVGDDVYAVGRRFEPVGTDFVQLATFWKNGVLEDLSGGENRSDATSVSVINGVIYVMGFEDAEPGMSTAKVWDITHGEAIDITDGTISSTATGLAIVGDLFIVLGEQLTDKGWVTFIKVNDEFIPIGSDLSASAGIIVK